MAHLGFGNTCGSTSKAVDALFTKQRDGTMERDIGGGFSVVRVTEDSPLLPAVIDVIARSECGSTTTAPDPLLDWVYSPRTEGVYGPLPVAPSSDRVEWFRWISTYSVLFGNARNGTYALVDQASRQVVAATVVGPPGTVEFGRMSTGEMEQNLRKAGMNMAIEFLVHNQRNKALGMWQAAAQESASLGKHLYILFFDTAPECQGRGCGSALLRFLGDVADADGVVSFLELRGRETPLSIPTRGGSRRSHARRSQASTTKGVEWLCGACRDPAPHLRYPHSRRARASTSTCFLRSGRTARCRRGVVCAGTTRTSTDMAMWRCCGRYRSSGSALQGACPIHAYVLCWELGQLYSLRGNSSYMCHRACNVHTI